MGKIIFVEYYAIRLKDDICSVTNTANLNVYPNILSPESGFSFKRNSTVNNPDLL